MAGDLRHFEHRSPWEKTLQSNKKEDLNPKMCCRIIVQSDPFSFTHTHTHTPPMYMYMYTYIYTHIYICVYVYIYIHTHPHQQCNYIFQYLLAAKFIMKSLFGEKNGTGTQIRKFLKYIFYANLWKIMTKLIN